MNFNMNGRKEDGRERKEDERERKRGKRKLSDDTREDHRERT